MSITPYRDMTGSDGLIANRKPFRGNSLEAIEFQGISPWGTGRLSHEESVAYYDFCDWIERNQHRTAYVIRSYRTPIAWAADGEAAYFVSQRFSVTTSKGQTYVRAWLNHNVRKQAAI